MRHLKRLKKNAYKQLLELFTEEEIDLICNEINNGMGGEWVNLTQSSSFDGLFYLINFLKDIQRGGGA
jgi:hypothetical protein